MTVHNSMHRIVACNTEAEADALLAELVADASLHNLDKTNEELVAICKANIGYASGYYEAETADRILRLFKTEHPVFGTSRPTADEAYSAGLRMGIKAREEAATVARTLPDADEIEFALNALKEPIEVLFSACKVLADRNASEKRAKAAEAMGSSA